VILGRIPWCGRLGEVSMISIQAIVGCALVLSGLCVENLASRSWRGGVRADRLDARAALALGLPALGLALMAAPIA
jgi:hypothetical protein